MFPGIPVWEDTKGAVRCKSQRLAAPEFPDPFDTSSRKGELIDDEMGS